MKNQDKKTPPELTNSQFIQCLFEDHELRQKQSVQNAQLVKIYDTSNESVLKMFSEQENQGMTLSQQSTNFTNTVVTHNSQNDQLQMLYSQPQAFSPPQQVNQKIGPEHFSIINLIGKGSFGEVYLVEKKGQYNKKYAMKVLNKSKILGMTSARPFPPTRTQAHTRTHAHT